jgi:hypothetical protein
MRWLSLTIGEESLDAGYMAQPRRTGHRNFPSGISHLKQVSGREFKDLASQIAPIIASHPKAEPRVKKSVRSFLDFSFLVQFPMHSSTSLTALNLSLDVYYSNREVFIINGSRPNGNPDQENHNIPKHHYWEHAHANIEDLGAADGFSTKLWNLSIFQCARRCMRHLIIRTTSLR